jgi:hypothetical protein
LPGCGLWEGAIKKGTKLRVREIPAAGCGVGEVIVLVREEGDPGGNLVFPEEPGSQAE